MKNIFSARKLCVIFAFFFIVLFSLETVKACSCAVSPTVDIAFEQTPTVAVLKVQAVEKYEKGEIGYGYGGIKQSKLTVEKVFKGKLKVGQEMTFAQGGGGDCIWTFTENSIGREYLLYLSDKPAKQNIWVAWGCSRSGSVEYRNSDLRYLENIEKVRGKTRLSGRLVQEIDSAIEGEESYYKPLVGRTVQIIGMGKNLKLKTDENGFYEIYDLPPGKYTIATEKLQGHKTGGNESRTVEIEAKSHTEENWIFFIDNEISGKVFDKNGNPLINVCLDLIPAYGTKSKHFYKGDCTDKEGSFSFDEIPIGRYLIIVNNDDEISAREPFGKFYYPNAVRREDAAEITIGAGEFFNELVITAPQMVETVTISGVVLFEQSTKNIKPAFEYVYVKFISDKSEENPENARLEGDSRGSVDQDGKFTITILKGQKGKLFAEKSIYEGEYEDCPKLEKLIRENKERFFEATTNTIEFEAVNDLIGIELRFPFPSCKKAKIE